MLGAVLALSGCTGIGGLAPSTAPSGAAGGDPTRA